MRAFFTRISAKSSIRDLNTISYIHTIVFWISDLNDPAKVPPKTMVYGPGMGVGGVGNKGGEGNEYARTLYLYLNPVFVKYNLIINVFFTIC